MQSIQGGAEVFGGGDFAADDCDDSNDWERAHRELERLAKTRAGLDWLEGQWLLRTLRAGAHVRLGFGGFPEYAAWLFGYSAKLTHDKLRVAEALKMAECDAQHLPSNGNAAHVGQKERTRARATQTVPPAVRRQVMRRDNGRCVVPGCRHVAWLDVHHLDPRAEGGTHDPERMACLCGAHHAAVHAGRIIIDGRASTGFVVQHADGTRYGGAVSPKAADVSSKVFQALAHMGFRESDARAAVRAASSGQAVTSVQDLLRRALALLTRS